MQLVPIPHDAFGAVEHRLNWHFQSFAEATNGARIADDFRKMVIDRDAQLWLAVEDGEIKAAALTQIRRDRTRTCDLIAGAGEDRESWQDMVQDLMQWAREGGSARFIATCRPGWEKPFKAHGFRRTHVILEVEL